MTAIERTAYPRFKSLPNLKELAELYTPTESELAFARVQTASKEGRFRLLISLVVQKTHGSLKMRQW